MTMDKGPEAVALVQLAKAQATKVDQLFHNASLKEDTGYHKEMLAASHSIVDCLLEGLNTARPEQFQKNFLVIAKAFNTELRHLLNNSFNEKHLRQKKYEELSKANDALEATLVSFIRQLQGLDSTNTEISKEHKS